MAQKQRRSRERASPRRQPPKKKAGESRDRSVQEIDLERGQHGVEEAKYELGPRLVEEQRPSTDELPVGYGVDKLLLMVRDPHWVYAYWEITPDRMKEGRAHLGDTGKRARAILRVYDITDVDFDGSNAHNSFDIQLTLEACNWYIHVQRPNRTYCVDFGLLTDRGEFFTLARSNSVTMPRDWMSDELDERWMSPREDFEKMYALSGGFKAGADSLALRELMEKRLQMELSSGALGSFELASGAFKKGQRGFWFQVDAELVIYGATEPNAHVTLQGKSIRLREDGTFTVRCALPDGEQVIPVTATSADGKEERTITPIVARRTEAPYPTIRGE